MESLANFKALGGRGELTAVKFEDGREVALIDEAYNANPASIRASLESLSSRSIASGARRVAVLGDILELGDGSHEIHRNLADSVLSANLDQVYLFGHHMRALYAELRNRTDSVKHWESLDEMRDEMLSLLQTNDVVLMKASQSTGLQLLVNELTSAENPGSP